MTSNVLSLLTGYLTARTQRREEIPRVFASSRLNQMETNRLLINMFGNLRIAS